MNSKGKPLNIPRSELVAQEKILFGVTPELKKKIADHAKQAGLTNSAFIRTTLADALK